MNEIKEILERNKGKKEEFTETLNTVCCKATKHGTYKDYGVLADIILILKTCEALINEPENNSGGNDSGDNGSGTTPI